MHFTSTATAAALILFSTAGQAQQFVGNGIYTIKSALRNLNVASMSGGAILGEIPSLTDGRQLWAVTTDGDPSLGGLADGTGTYLIYNRQTGQYLGASQAQAPAHGVSPPANHWDPPEFSTAWLINNHGSDVIIESNLFPGQILDLDHSNGAADTPINVWPNQGGANQVWELNWVSSLY